MRRIIIFMNLLIKVIFLIIEDLERCKEAEGTESC